MSRNWNILNWNVRGINSQIRWDDIRAKIDESNCGIICLQETKRDFFDQAYLRNFSPRRYNQFAYTASVGLSGGIITIWNGSLFLGYVVSQNTYQITVRLSCNLSGNIFYISNIYGPCHNDDRTEFFDWLSNIDASQMDHWILMGDFNLIRSPLDRNRPGGDTNNMLIFNSLLQ